MLIALVSVLSMASCGGSTSAGSPNSSQHATAQAARAVPSASAKMICARHTQTELAAVLGARTTQPVVPTWTDHIYSCRYTYNNAVMVLSVKELSSKTETDAYFTSLAHRLGQTERLTLGQGGFTTKNRSVVVRKDYKVLLVDISALPARFGVSPGGRGDIAINVAATIMACWTGA
jgi:hypothetical protein